MTKQSTKDFFKEYFSKEETKKKLFIPSVNEDLNRPHNVTLTEGQISTILYVLEGYIQNSDDTDDENFNNDVDNIFEKLETAVDIHETELDALTNINPEPFITGFHD